MKNEQLKTIIQSEGEYIWIKPICDFFDLNYENTTRKIKADPILAKQSTKKSNRSMFSDNYPRVLLSKKGFIRWIQITNSNTVCEEHRSSFLNFQETVFDFLYGSIEENQKVNVDFTRLKKLERLKRIITNEIAAIRRRLDNYWTNKHVQREIVYPDQKSIEK